MEAPPAKFTQRANGARALPDPPTQLQQTALLQGNRNATILEPKLLCPCIKSRAEMLGTFLAGNTSLGSCLPKLLHCCLHLAERAWLEDLCLMAFEG